MAATDTAVPNSQSRRSLRIAVVVGLSALVIGLTVPNIFVFRGNVVGIDLGNDWTVTSVDESLGASLRVGDRIDPSSLSPYDRQAVGGSGQGERQLRPGETLHLTVIRDGMAVPVSVQVAPESASDYNHDVVQTALKRITAGIFIILAASLVLIRPSRMTWGFFLFALGSTNASPYVLQLVSPGVYVAGWSMFDSLSTGAVAAGILIFAARFPNDTAFGWRAVVDRGAVFSGVATAGLDALSFAAILGGWGSVSTWAVASNIANAVVFGVGLLALISSYFGLAASDQPRFKWVIGGFGIYLLATVYNLNAGSLPGGGWPASWTAAGWTVDDLNSLVLCIPATVVYAVLKHHVLDINFVISRTLVYGVLTSMLVGSFALVDWFVTRAMEQQRLAIYAEIAVALGFGFGLNGLHRRVDMLIDRVLFRRRYLAEARLERIAAGISHAVSADAVDAALVDEPVKAFQLTTAAIFRKQAGADYVRAAATGWTSGTAPQMHPNDPVVLHMQGERGPMRLRDIDRHNDDFPKGAEAPIIAFPLIVRHQPEGIALYGTHMTGEDIDPDEVRTLERLAVSAAAAYDHLEADALRRELEESRREIESVRLQLRALKPV